MRNTSSAFEDANEEHLKRAPGRWRDLNRDDGAPAPQTTGVMAHVWRNAAAQNSIVIPGRAKHEPGIHLSKSTEFADAWIPGSRARSRVHVGLRRKCARPE